MYFPTGVLGTNAPMIPWLFVFDRDVPDITATVAGVISGCEELCVAEGA